MLYILYIYIIDILSHSISYSLSYWGLALQGEPWWPGHITGFIHGSTHPHASSRRHLGTTVIASCSEVSWPVTQGTGLAVWLPDIKSSMRTCRKTAQGCGPVNSVIFSIQWIHISYPSSRLPALKVLCILIHIAMYVTHHVIMKLLRRQPLLNLTVCNWISVSLTGEIEMRLQQCTCENVPPFETDV